MMPSVSMVPGRLPPLFAVDNRERDRAEHVADDHYVRAPEVDHAVAVRVGGGHGEDVHLLAVQVDLVTSSL